MAYVGHPPASLSVCWSSFRALLCVHGEEISSSGCVVPQGW